MLSPVHDSLLWALAPPFLLSLDGLPDYVDVEAETMPVVISPVITASRVGALKG